jgi:CDP-paratose 2-epimerase
MGPPRQSDQKVFVADIEKAKSLLGWMPSVNAAEGVSRMLDWSREIASV